MAEAIVITNVNESAIKIAMKIVVSEDPHYEMPSAHRHSLKMFLAESLRPWPLVTHRPTYLDQAWPPLRCLV